MPRIELQAKNPQHAALDSRANELQANNPQHAALDRRANDRARTVEARAQVRGSRKTAATSPSSQRPHDVPPEVSEDYGAFVGSLGTKNPEFVDGLVAQLLSISARDGGKFHARELSFALAVIKGSKPPDELEAMHIAQMAAVHEAMMRVAGEVARAEYQLERESAMRALNQLARTSCAQLDALKRYRAKAENVSVQNVAIAQAGGDAVSKAGRPALNSEVNSGIAQAILGRPGPAI